ncbi:hypothetical protein LINPERHAP2_LOCUS1003 [Linum perenne]
MDSLAAAPPPPETPKSTPLEATPPSIRSLIMLNLHPGTRSSVSRASISFRRQIISFRRRQFGYSYSNQSFTVAGTSGGGSAESVAFDESAYEVQRLQLAIVDGGRS